jgi:serine/threonine-protein phosphatase 2A regulatory subunit B
LYENDSIFDKFDCCINGKGDAIATGSYNNLFRVFGTWNSQDLTLEASRDPMRKRLQTQSKVGCLASSRRSALQSFSLTPFLSPL